MYRYAYYETHVYIVYQKNRIILALQGLKQAFKIDPRVGHIPVRQEEFAICLAGILFPLRGKC